MHNRFEAIRKVLEEQPLQGELASASKSDKTPKLDKQGMQREINSNAQKLHEQIKELHNILQDPFFGGKIDLGTDLDKTNWDAMPKEIAACFKPEFDYQPEDITAFTISTGIDSSSGRNGIEIGLKRRGLWWSYVYVGAFVRKDSIGGASYIACKAESAQPKAAREAMKKLDEGLWSRKTTQGLEDQQLPFMVHDVNELRLTKRVLDFTMNALETQVGLHTTFDLSK